MSATSGHGPRRTARRPRRPGGCVRPAACRAKALPRDSNTPLILRAVPFDDDAEADNGGFRPPPHPDDRLWRHPSEMDAHPIVPIGAPARRPAVDPATAQGERWPGRPRWVVAAVAGSGAVLLAGGAMVALAAGPRPVAPPPAEQATAGTSAGPDDRREPLRSPQAGTAPTVDEPVQPDEEAEPGPAIDTARAQVAPAVVRVGVGTGPGADAGGETGPVAGAGTGGDPAPEQVEFAGSGLLVRADGIVVTSAALVESPSQAAVVLPDGTQVAADVVGADPATGLAVLALAGGADLPVGVLAEAADLAPGDTAVALDARAVAGLGTADAGGTAATLRYTGPTGPALDGAEVEGEADVQALGGPVVDGNGAVVGIVAAVDDGGAWQVAPVEVARRVVDELLADGVARHAWLGIEGLDAAPAGDAPGTFSAAAPATGGIEVASVVAGGPAAGGGLQPGDVIVALDGQAVTHLPDLFVGLRARAPGDRLEVTVARAGGGSETVTVTLGATPPEG